MSKTKRSAVAEDVRIQDFLDMIAPSVVKFNTDHFICGNTYRCVWALREYPTATDEQGMYLRDKWGEMIYEWADEQLELPEFNPQSCGMKTCAETMRTHRPKVNPDYDENRTCQPDGFCRPNSDGIATASVQGYRVLERLHKDIVLILLDGPLK